MANLCVFVSYSSADKQIAEQVHQQLKAAGYEVWRDKTRLEIDWSREISRALVETVDVICLLWTGAAEASEWVQHEFLTARALGKRIIPCIYAGAPPLPLALKHLDAIEVEDNDSPMPKLLEKLRRGSALEEPYDYNLRSPGVHLPFNHNPSFVGRDSELAEIYQMVVGSLDKTGVSVTGIAGMGGVGKTQIVAEFAIRYGFAFKSVHWISASRFERWFEMLVDLAKTQLPLKVDAPDAEDVTTQYFRALRKYFQGNPRVLLVFDNVGDPRHLASEQPFPTTDTTVLTLGCSVLFTTQHQVDLTAVRWKHIGMLPAAAAVRLLTQGREPVDAVERKNSEEICSIMGFLPLALILANGFLRYSGSLSYRKYREALPTDRLGIIDLSEISEEQLATRHTAAIEKTLQDQLAGLGRDDTALHLLQLSSFFADAELIPKELLESFGDVGRRRSEVDHPFDRAIHRLRSRCLLEEVSDGTAVHLHPLLRAAIGRRIADEQRIKREAAQRFANVYSDFQKLEATYLSRGIDNLLLDIATAAKWASEGGHSGLNLVMLFRVLSQSATILRNAEVGKRNVFFAQQVALRAAQFGLEDLKQRGEDRGVKLGGYTFSLRWARGHGMPALLRTIDPEAEHRGGSNIVAISGTGRYIITNGGDRRITVWDGVLGIYRYDLEADAPVRAIAFVGSTSCFVIASESETIDVWDAEKAACVHSLTGKFGATRSVAVTPDGTQVIAVCGDNTVRVWTLDVVNPPSVRQLRWFSSGDRTRPIQVHCGGQGERVLAVIVLDDRTARVGDLNASVEETRHINFGERHLTVSRRGDYAVAWSGTQSAGVWNLASGQCERTLKADHAITDVAIAAEAGLLVMTEFYGDLLVVDFPFVLSPKRLLGTHGIGTGANVAVVPDGSMLASLAFGEVRVWNASERWPRMIPPGHRTTVCALDMLAGAHWFASASWDTTAKIWSLDDGAMLRSFERHRKRLDVLSLSSDGTAITSGVDTFIWEVESCRVLKQMRGGSIAHIRRSPLRIVMAMFDGTVSVTDADHGTRDIGHHRQLTALALVGEGQFAATGAGDGTIRTWNLAEFREQGGFPLHNGSITGLAAVTGTEYIVSGSQDGAVKLCRWRHPNDAITLKQPGNPVRAVAASPSGRRVVSADGATVRVWSIAGAEELGNCQLWDEVRCLLMPKDDLVVAGDSSGNLYCLRFGLPRES